MKNKKLSKRARIFLFAGAGVLAAGAAVLGIFFVRHRNALSFRELYARGGELLDQGITVQVPEILAEMEKSARDSVDYLRTMELALVYAGRQGDYRPFNSAARRAAERYPGRQDLLALEVYGLLRSGAYARALELSAGLRESRWDGIRAEALLLAPPEVRAGGGDAGEAGDEAGGGFSGAGPEDGNPFVNAARAREGERLLAAAELTGVPELYLDAALLFLGEGQVSRAGWLAGELLREYPGFSLLAGIDAGLDYQALAALEILENSGEAAPVQSLIRGDILIRQSGPAGEFYRAFLEEHPGVSWLPWYNLYHLEREARKAGPAGETPGGIARDAAILEQGLVFFPGQEDLSLALARAEIARGRPETAEAILEDMIRRNVRGFRAELELLRLLGGRRPAYLEGRYWDLVNRFPGEPEPARAFAFYLLSWGDWEELGILLDRHEKNGGSGGWIGMYRGIARAVQGDLEAADGYMSVPAFLPPEGPAGAVGAVGAARRRENFALCYNSGMVKLARGRYREAQELFRTAETFLAAGADDPAGRRLRGQARISLGIAFFLDNDFAAARRELLYGHELYPENLKGIYYLKQLDASGRAGGF